MTDQKMDEEQSNHRTDEQLKDGILLGKQPRRMPIFLDVDETLAIYTMHTESVSG